MTMCFPCWRIVPPAHDVDSTYINGNAIMKNRRMVGLDKQRSFLERWKPAKIACPAIMAPSFTGIENSVSISLTPLVSRSVPTMVDPLDPAEPGSHWEWTVNRGLFLPPPAMPGALCQGNRTAAGNCSFRAAVLIHLGYLSVAFLTCPDRHGTGRSRSERGCSRCWG